MVYARLLTRAAQSTAPRAFTRAFGTTRAALGPSYTASAVASGAGRNGKIQITSDQPQEFKLAMPKALGGQGDGENPERLFAGGYAACYLSALQLVARQNKVNVSDVAIHTDVTIAQGDDGFGLSVVLTGKSDELPKEELQKLMDEAHQVCPYSKATRNNIPVEIKVA